MWINGQPITFFGGSSPYNPRGEAVHHPPLMATMDASNDQGPGAIQR